MRPPLLITAPTADVVTLDEVKAGLRITTTADDDLIAALIESAVSNVDPAKGGWLDRALRPQTWELQLDEFPCGEIKLPFPPLISITSFKYDDTGGTERTLAVTTGYRIVGAGSLYKQSLFPPYNTSWPTARCDVGSVRIRFQSGYAVTPDAMPAPIKQAIILGVRELYSLSERSLFVSRKVIEGVSETQWIVSDAASNVMQAAMNRLLMPYQVF